MLKKVLKGMLIGAGMMAMAATAQAAHEETNMYGASAEFKLFVDIADDLCISKGYTTTNQYDDGKYGITECSNAAGDTYTIRYASKASYDGIYSCYGETNVPAGQDSCATGVVDYPGTHGPRYRAQLDAIATKTLRCYEVNIGASDVPGYAFGQTSNGHKCGPFDCKDGTNPVENKNVPAIDDLAHFTQGTIGDEAPGEVFNGLTVPFGFFVNDTALPEINNITRPMAGIIFSGLDTFWADFDNYDLPADFDATFPGIVDYPPAGNEYPAVRAIACLRHAGSGTHATLFQTVMKQARGGYTVAVLENIPWLWFNDGSGEMEKCIRGNGGIPYGYGAAIGYLDCDRCGNDGICDPEAGKTYTSALTGATVADGGARLVRYQGAVCNAQNIQNCVYDFWSSQNVYFCNPVPGSVSSTTLTANMIDYALQSVIASKAGFWVSGTDMRCYRPTGMTGDISPVPSASSQWGTGTNGPTLW